MFFILLFFFRLVKGFNPNWYVIGRNDNFPVDTPVRIIINNNPITVWKNKHNQFSGIYDVCPHRGASLSEGRIDKATNCVVCPYHTFKFNKKGRLVQTPGQSVLRNNDNFNLKTDVPHYKISCVHDWVYIHNKPIYEISGNSGVSSSTIWVEPEAYDPNFKCVYLYKDFDMDARTVTENSLDILHISEVHSFGNKKNPLPLTEKKELIEFGHQKVIYEYLSGQDSVASKIFKINELSVENEYILPHHTVARVRFGNFVNTIVTSALPIGHNKTRLFVKAYRNNWYYKFPPVDFIFDKISEQMMEKTLCEDKKVIETIYSKFRDGNFITKYDELTKNYREDYENFLHKNQL